MTTIPSNLALFYLLTMPPLVSLICKTISIEWYSGKKSQLAPVTCRYAVLESTAFGPFFGMSITPPSSIPSYSGLSYSARYSHTLRYWGDILLVHCYHTLQPRLVGPGPPPKPKWTIDFFHWGPMEYKALKYNVHELLAALCISNGEYL